jgi:serine/threonine-protein kinase HipA
MLNVWTADRLSGAIDHSQEDQRDYVFAYRTPAVPGQDVSLTMPFSLESYSYRNGLHPVFQMNLPEGRLRESIERAFRKRTEGFDQLKLLEDSWQLPDRAAQVLQ